MTLNKCVTWDKITPVDRALLIVNSMPNDYDSVNLALDALYNLVPKEGLWIIAEPHWQDHLVQKGVSPDMIRPTVLFSWVHELMFFLEQPYTIEWVRELKPQLIMGSLAHNLYNEEIKELFEQKVRLFLGQALFMAHTLPNNYVYLMNLEDLFERQLRPEKMEHFQNISGAIVNDLYQLWLDKGQPLFDDDPNFENEERILAKHLGQAVLSYDEVSEIPLCAAPYLKITNNWIKEMLAYEARITQLQAERNYLEKQWPYLFLRKISGIEEKLKAIFNSEG